VEFKIPQWIYWLGKKIRVPGFQFWPKSESLGLNGAQPVIRITSLNERTKKKKKTKKKGEEEERRRRRKEKKKKKKGEFPRIYIFVPQKRSHPFER
jgi:hypothetical protein